MSQTIFTSAQNITTIQLQFIIESTVVRNWNTTCLTKPKYLPQQKYKTYNCNALEYGTSYSFYLSIQIVMTMSHNSKAPQYVQHRQYCGSKKDTCSQSVSSRLLPYFQAIFTVAMSELIYRFTHVPRELIYIDR